MGGWALVGAYAAGLIALLSWRLARRRAVVLPLGRLYPAQMLLSAAILGNAAVIGAREIAGPLIAALLSALLSAALRDLWIVAGRGDGTALDALERLCRRREIPTVRDGGALVLKRLGTKVRVTPAGPGIGLAWLDRRRREREVDRLAPQWESVLARPDGAA